jgi:hypothetical protein
VNVQNRPWQEVNMEIVVDRCPSCDATTVTPGALRHDGHFMAPTFTRFEPEGMRFFSLRWKWGVALASPFRCCLACGLVWTKLPGDRLRVYMKAHGDSIARKAVEPFEKKIVDEELA